MPQGHPGTLDQRHADNEQPPERYHPHEGYIQLWRRIRSHRFWHTQEDRPATRAEAWADILFLCAHSHRERFWHGIHVVEEPGEWVTSEPEFAELMKWGRKRTRNFLNDLEKGGETANVRYKWGTRITVLGRTTYENRLRRKGQAKVTLGAKRGPTSKEGKEGRELTPPQLPTVIHSEPSDSQTVKGNSTPPDPDATYHRLLTKQALDVTEAFRVGAKLARATSPHEVERTREAIKAHDGPHTDLVEFTVSLLSDAPKDAQGRPRDKKGSPIGSVSYVLAAWGRRGASQASRDASRREPEPESGVRAFHEPAKVVKPQPLTDEQTAVNLERLRAITTTIGSGPSKGPKK